MAKASQVWYGNGGDDEIWCPIDGYEGRYEVSSNGRVRSMPRTIVQKDGGYKWEYVNG